MEDQTRYAFCIEMANLARQNGMSKSANKWYARAWTLILKDSEYEKSGAWNTFWEVSNDKVD